MPLIAVGLVLASCGLHALWNLFVKQGRDKVAFTALFLLAIPVLFAPMFLALLPTRLPSTHGWLCAVATGVVYTAYFFGLARAYEVSDLSVAYPLVLKRKGTTALWEEWQRSKWLCLATAVLNIAAYLLVLFALSLPLTPISYVIPLRTVGILFGVLLGTEVLGETGRWRKSLAALALMAGVTLIAGA